LSEASEEGLGSKGSVVSMMMTYVYIVTVVFCLFYFKHLIIFQVYIKKSIILIYKCNKNYVNRNIIFVLHIALYLNF